MERYWRCVSGCPCLDVERCNIVSTDGRRPRRCGDGRFIKVEEITKEEFYKIMGEE